MKKNLKTALGSEFEGITPAPYYLARSGWICDFHTSAPLFRMEDSPKWRERGERIVALMNKYAESNENT